ncbi:MAG: hypothetical protein KDA33_13150, partial [Phycisphaerales bacterium]|nr:hypothetical protein [Phycisphaerales bacterium]
DQTRGLDEPKASKPAPAADRSSMNAGAAGNRALPEGHPPITGGAPTPVENSTELPKGHPALPPGMVIAGSQKAAPSGPAPDLSGLPIGFDAPAGWIAEAPKNSFRTAQFRIPHIEGDAEDGEMTLSHFGMNSGNLMDNVSRWVGQFSTVDGAPIPESGRVIESLEINGMKVTTVDVAGKYASGPMMGGSGNAPDGVSRMLAAIVETPGGPWYFKAVGPVDTMAKQKTAFDDMIKTVKWKDGGA